MKNATNQPTKRTVASAGKTSGKKKIQPVASGPSAAQFDKNAVDTPGFCTHPDLKLSKEEITTIQGLHGDTNKTEESNGAIQVSVLKEKDLVGKGTKRLYKMTVEGSDDKFCFYFDGKKCVKQDRLRIEAMAEAARSKDGAAYVLLAAGSGICKRNTLPELVGAGYVVQRVDE
jgi:hypothetical protein